MKRPTTKANYTAEELRQYAHHRKKEAIQMVGNTLNAVSDSDTSCDEPSDYDDYREPLVLQVLMGFSTNEIAEQMGLKQGAVLTRLHRARAKLKRTMQAQAVD